MESILMIDNFTIERNFNEWKINITMYLDSIIFKIQNNYSIYESSFNIKYLHQ
jgi:hypothetical protein